MPQSNIATAGGRDYRDRIAWQKAMDLVELVYRLTQDFPVDERFGLISQLRRCAVSVPSNVAEGQGRGGNGDFFRFLQIAHGSLRELETQIEISFRLSFIDSATTQQTQTLSAEVGRLINGLIRAKRPA